MPLLLRYWYHGASAFAPARDEIKYSDYQLNNHNRYDNTLVGCIQFKAFYPYSNVESRKLITPFEYPNVRVLNNCVIEVDATNAGYMKPNFEKMGPEDTRDFIINALEREIKKYD